METQTVAADAYSFDKVVKPIHVACPFCRDEEAIPAWQNITHHAIITKDRENHYHVHGPLDDKETVRKMVSVLQSYC